MISKNLVGIVLVTILIIYSGITLFSSALSALMISITLFVISFILLSISFFSFKNSVFDNLFVFLEILIFCFVLSSLVWGFKNYSDSLIKLDFENNKVNSEIDYLEELNSYNRDEVELLNDKVIIYKENNFELEKAISDENTKLNDLLLLKESTQEDIDSFKQEEVQMEYVNVPTYYYYGDDYEDD